MHIVLCCYRINIVRYWYLEEFSFYLCCVLLCLFVLCVSFYLCCIVMCMLNFLYVIVCVLFVSIVSQCHFSGTPARSGATTIMQGTRR